MILAFNYGDPADENACSLKTEEPMIAR